ncbi:LAQU0S02e02190g1_1 [Lachancea quebecensis]|uniref:LAQU0S02e02190g1_1 n=1 Tax=Lachancea quebecensis TaxID=1654605 RepID=A0A0P1KXV2_9SACH|nr:LAQU0S02e02190g1_1 [Lachancea quebecensis]
MSLNFLPGQPNDTLQTVCQSSWQGHTLMAYCSGNNLIILSNDFSKLQTIYLESDCIAVDIDASNGHIAVAFGSAVYIYKPLHQVMRNPRWVFCTKIFHDDSRVNAISWGSNGELAVGSDYLSFWKIREEFGIFTPSLLWTKKQFKPVYRCAVSEDSQVIASMHKYSNNVRLWKRISIGGDRDLFDLTVISHPAPVATFRWKRTTNFCDEERDSHVLYTLCSDGKLRIWVYFEVNSRKTVQQWGNLELDKAKNQRFCFILDSWLVQEVLSGRNTSEFEYFSQLHPEVAIIADSSGNLDVYALENLSHNPPKLMSKRKLFSTQIEPGAFVHLPEYLYFAEPQLTRGNSKKISLIVHDIKGVLRHSSIDLAGALAGQNGKFGTLLHKFTGHNKSIQKLGRSSDGMAMITLSRFSENCIWVPQPLPGSMSLRKKNIIYSGTPLLDAVVLERGALVVTLSKNLELQVWDCPDNKSGKKSILKSTHVLEKLMGEPRLMLNTPEKKHQHDCHFIALIYSSGQTCGFEVSSSRGIVPVKSSSLDIGDEKDIYLVSSINPVNYGFFADRSLVSIITKSGLIKTFKSIVMPDFIEWKLTFEMDTGLSNPTLICGSSIDKICVVDESRLRLTIWDLRRSFLEHEESFDDLIRDVDWTSTRFSQSIFSIGFKDHSLLFTQLRYDYTSKNPSYCPVEKIDLSQHTTHPVGDSIWMTDGTFVAASGNQLFIKDKYLDIHDTFTNQSIGSRRILSNDIMHLSTVLNGPLPVYHPQMLIQALYAGKLKLVREILLRLFLKLRDFEFKSIDVAEIGSTLELSYQKFICPSEESYLMDPYPEPYSYFSASVSLSLKEKLAKHALPFLTRHQQVTLLTVIEAIEDMDKNGQALDFNGMLFILGVKLFELHRKTQESVNVRDALWCLCSKNRKVLFLTVMPNINSWKRAREYKISYWAERDDLVATFDNIAKFEFSNDANRDPRSAGIFYLSLKKKQILTSLWRISAGHPEQQKMLRFLNNDFREPRWRRAAFKNAFVLLSKHRFTDAACFFLLADSLKDAVNVILKQMDDLPLAFGVCRVYEGDFGPVLKDVLLNNILPQAVLNNDRWLTSLIYHAINEPSLAMKALIMSPIHLSDNAKLVSQQESVNKSFLVEDPALLMLYRQVRRMGRNLYAASLEVDTELEYKTVLRVAAIYSRMGCDFLALSLIVNWRFEDKFMRQKNNSEVKKALEKVPTNHDEQPARFKSIFEKFDDMSGRSLRQNTNTTGDTSSNNTQVRSLLDDF